LLILVLAALAVPALLALGVHFAAGGSLTAPPPLVARVSTAPLGAPSIAPPATTTTSGSGRCAEPEHRNDPRCVSSNGVTTTEDHSGRGSGNSGSGKSGSGRSGSGHSGGDD
jgi:uncharacterized membrane protein YgcG